ncbi:T9SS type A sorting domain-containing protein [Flavobacterium cerinum]|uniref:T9SS type A sorting domain-containing protein n=1 Tax=Flavobacterium cerinum TaxID=2502784 RepID=A0A3S3SDM5_9FLAO|nr:T9SS type A sorting domain-containing protein [Flavobacterium cerinum]RWW98818.1 T9SS type A sorting domain-containing protein [Flavobacterium cerinum]
MRKYILFFALSLGSMHLHAQGCVPNLTLTTPETSTPVLHQASNTVVASSNYGVSSGYNATLRAGTLVELKSNTHIKSGSLFLAKIGACTKAKNSEQGMSDELSEDVALTIYPNPVRSFLTVSIDKMEMSKITVSNLEGKVITTYDAKKQTSLQLNFENYTPGVYTIIVETVDGSVFREKIIKN